LKINPIKRKTVCDEIVEQIKQLIEEGELKVGDKLPPEREMSKMFNVGRPSIREAIIVLSSQGLLEKNQDGTFVKERNESNYITLINNKFLDDKDYLDLYEARKHIETVTAELAAKNADDEDKKALLEIITEMKEVEFNDIGEFARLDADFHQCIALSSKNIILYNIISDILDLLRNQIMENTTKLLQDKDINIYYETLQDHNNIFNSIQSGDALKANYYISYHLDKQIIYRNAIKNGK
jgi:GntR family transcriptional repressor for pyruvate dehydrogenase complex